MRAAVSNVPACEGVVGFRGFNHLISFLIIYYYNSFINKQMKKAGKFFSDMVSKGKQMLEKNKKDQMSPSDKNGEDNGFDSGEDDDLIEIGKHKGAGAKSLFQNLESLTGNQIIQEDKYALEFRQQSSGSQKSQGAKNEIDFIKEAIEQSFVVEDNPEEESKEQGDRIKWTNETSFFSLSSFDDIEESIANRNTSGNGVEDTKYFEFVCVVGFHHSVGS